jgi:putative PIG3 family NAD(P)H quinone oxidoreductase
VLIAVEAAGVNRPDLMQREGRYPPPPGITDIPGLEVSGRIVGLGLPNEHGVPQSASGRVWREGDRVCALLAGGGYAERCVAPGVQCLPVPDGLSMTDSAALPETFFTVWTNLVERGRLAHGDWALVHGGASGIGTTAIQIASARGARVIATAGSDAKCRACESLGATRAINYHNENFVDVVKHVTASRGVDVVLDFIGGAYLARNLECLARDGRLVQIGLMGGSTAEVPLRPILLKRLTITGSTLRIRTPAEKGVIALALEREVWPLVASGRIRPQVGAVLPLADAAEAHRRLEAGGITGKVVLRVQGSAGSPGSAGSNL